MKILSLLSRLREAMSDDHRRVSYAQCGEDLILDVLFDLFQIWQPTYLDIGAHHPMYLSNTYFFYKKGSRGVCVEPNPDLHTVIKRQRPNDVCLNEGIGFTGSDKLRFYILDDPTLSTFSESIVHEQLAQGRVVKAELEVAVESVNDIVEKFLLPHPNFVSLDTEGLDLEILKSWDFERFRADAFCVETITNVEKRKTNDILEFMAARGYDVFADTFINTIFVERTRWKKQLASFSATRSL